MAVRVGINGFGRMGRALLRLAQRPEFGIEVVAVNDLGSAEALTRLFARDSVYGRVAEPVRLDGEHLVVGDTRVQLLAEPEIKALPWAELGVDVSRGCLRFAPRLLHRSEFSAEGRPFAYVNLKGEDKTWDLPPDSLAFTYCQVPVCYTLADAPVITVEWADGRKEFVRSDSLNAEISSSIFSRRDEVARLIVQVPRQAMRD